MIKTKRLQVLLVALVIIGVNTVAAQESSKESKPARLGVRAGWNYAAMFTDKDILKGTDPLNSFYIGVFKEKKLVPLLWLGSGLDYMQNGYIISDNIKRQIHYISVPLYLKVKVGPVYATGGTGFNFKVAENLPGTSLLDPLNNKSSNFFDMPFQLGAGLKILMFSIEARYNWGMLLANQNASNQYLQVGFTVSF